MNRLLIFLLCCNFVFIHGSSSFLHPFFFVQNIRSLQEQAQGYDLFWGHLETLYEKDDEIKQHYELHKNESVCSQKLQEQTFAMSKLSYDFVRYRFISYSRTEMIEDWDICRAAYEHTIQKFNYLRLKERGDASSLHDHVQKNIARHYTMIWYCQKLYEKSLRS